MEKSETIVADQTCEYSNAPHESSGDDALRVARPDHPGGLASIQAIALSECCSIVIWRTHRVEDGRVLRVCRASCSLAKAVSTCESDICAWGALRCIGDSMDTGSDVQSGERPWTEMVDGGMPKANLIDRSRPGGSGRSIDDLPDNNGKEKRPSGYWLSLRQWKNRLLPVRAMQPYVFHPPELREEQTFIPLNWGLSMHQTEREGCM